MQTGLDVADRDEAGDQSEQASQRAFGKVALQPGAEVAAGKSAGAEKRSQRPGGGIEDGDDAMVATRREIYEATGLPDLELEAEVWQRLGEANVRRARGRGRVQTRVLTGATYE